MNYLFYDYETSGRNEKYDQILQFAAIKTDSEFSQVGEPIEYFCKLRRDVLPSPTAIKINQIDIDELNVKGLVEFEFAKRVADVLIGDGNQCVVGYNSKSFDDKFTRFLFYRNFIDPYAWFWKNGNSCFDIFDVMSLGYSFNRLREIKFQDDTEVSLRLEDLTRWNNLEHDDAHNAVSDVKATIGLAKLIKRSSPKLFEYAFNLRSYVTANQIIKSCDKYFSSSSVNGYSNRFLSLHTPICDHPMIPKSTIAWNLKYDPTDILQMSIEEIRGQMYSKKETRTVEVGFGDFRLNQCPMILKYFESGKDLLNRDADFDSHFVLVKENLGELRRIATEVFDTKVPEVDPDVDLYVADFFTQVDKHRGVFISIRENPLAVNEAQFLHLPFLRLFRRLKARNFYDKLESDEQEQFDSHCARKFGVIENVDWVTRFEFDAELNELLNSNSLTERQTRSLVTLRQYASNL